LETWAAGLYHTHDFVSPLKYNEIIYITRNSNRLKPSGESVSFVYQKAKGP